MPLKVDRSSLDSGVEVVTLGGSLTLGRDAQNFEFSIEELIKNQKTRIVLDLSEVTFVDSAGIGILVGCHGKVATAGGKLRMAGLTPRVLNVLRITKVDSILTLDDNVAASLAALSAS
jgi:anti-sigma B factor antagonist